MTLFETFFLLFLVTQIFHSLEEVATGFHKRFPLFTMPLWLFIVFELLFQGFFWLVFSQDPFEMKVVLGHVFALLMFANGLWHIVWWGIEKRYVPGLLTAPILLVEFVVFYFAVLA